MVEPLTPEPSFGPQPTPKKRGLGLGCQILLGLLLLFLLLVGVGAVFTYKTVNFFYQALEDKPAQYVREKLSVKEELELQTIAQQYRNCFQTKTDFEVSFSLRQLNDFMARQILKDNQGKAPEEMPQVQFSFEGERSRIRFTIPTEQEKKRKWVNGNVLGALVVKDGRCQIQIDELRLGDNDAPWIVKWYLRKVSEGLSQGQGNAEVPPDLEKVLQAVKLLERNGEAIHLILDGKHLKEPDQPPAPPASESGLERTEGS